METPNLNECIRIAEVSAECQRECDEAEAARAELSSLTARNRRLEAALRELVRCVDTGGQGIQPLTDALTAARAALSETTDGNEQKASG